MLPPLTPNPKIRLGAITVEKSPSQVDDILVRVEASLGRTTAAVQEIRRMLQYLSDKDESVRSGEKGVYTTSYFFGHDLPEIKDRDEWSLTIDFNK